MCLAVPGKIIELREGSALADFQGNRVEVCTVLTPEVRAHDWVLVHAGFAITRIDEDTARQTWAYLNEMWHEPTSDEASGATHSEG